MRIALVHYTKPPVVGGVERVIADQAAALAGLGHEVEIVDFEGMAELERAVECRRVVGSPIYPTISPLALRSFSRSRRGMVSVVSMSGSP